jgi:hypothetical protein
VPFIICKKNKKKKTLDHLIETAKIVEQNLLFKLTEPGHEAGFNACPLLTINSLVSSVIVFVTPSWTAHSLIQ